MKTSHLRILVAALLLVAVVMLPACSGGGNTSVNSNATGNANAGSQNASEAASLTGANCADAVALQRWIDNRLNHEHDENDTEVHYTGDLRDHTDTSSGKPAPIVFTASGPVGPEHRFTVTVVGILRATVPTASTPVVNDKHRARKSFERIIEALTDRAGTSPCKIDIVFRSPVNAAMLDFGEDGFVSSSCDWPLVPCDGACQQTCNRKSGGTSNDNSLSNRPAGNLSGNSNASNLNRNGSNTPDRKQSP